MPFACTDILERLKLEPHPPEGGYFKPTYQSSDTIDLRKGHSHAMGSGIYFLLSPESFSAYLWLAEDEVYSFYFGDLVEFFHPSAKDGQIRTTIGKNLANGKQVQHPVLKDCWQRSWPIKGREWALIGTTVEPGFTWQDFELETGKNVYLNILRIRASFLN